MRAGASSKTKAILLAAAMTAIAARETRAVVIYDSATQNTTRPNGSFGYGWDFEGTYGSFTGTPVAPNYFVTAQHIGYQDFQLVYHGVTYTVDGVTDIPNTDLRIDRVTGTFPSWAQMYSGSGDSSGSMYVFGRGVPRTTEEVRAGPNNELKGWTWYNSSYTGQMSWGHNDIAGIYTDPSTNRQYIVFTFDAIAGQNECQLTNYDSGGGLFINDNGTWKLAGINNSVQGFFKYQLSDPSPFSAAIFDQGGLYYPIDNNGNYALDPDTPTDDPTYGLTSRISSSYADLMGSMSPDVNMFNGSSIDSTMTVSLKRDMNYNGATAAATVAGNIVLTADNANHNFIVNDGSDASDLNITGVISGSGTVTKLGSGTLTLSGANTYTGATIVSAGKLAVANNFTKSASVTVNDGAIFEMSSNGAHVLKTASVSFSGSGKLDLKDNDAILTGMTRANVETLLKNGYGTGTWNGTGITSSTAAAGATTALGVISASDASYTSFSGQTVSSTDTLVKYTYSGDSNLDGKVTFDDFNNFLIGFTTNDDRWFTGDFNYSGTVTFDDFQLLIGGMSAYNTSGITLAPTDAQLAQAAALNQSATPTPEPAAIVPMSVAAILLRRRARKH